MKISFLVAALVCTVLPLCAQTPNPDLPTGPLLKPAADFCQWEITFTYPEDRKKDKDKDAAPDRSLAARLRKTVTTRTGRFVHEAQTRLDNSVLDLWYNGPTEFVKVGNNPTWFETSVAESKHSALPASVSPLPPGGFRDVEFINESSYAGTIAYGNGKALVFIEGSTHKIDLKDPEQLKKMETAEVIAYVDEDTRWPIAVRAHGVLRSFHFDPPPTVTLTFPDDLTSQVRKGEEGNRRLAMPAPRPY